MTLSQTIPALPVRDAAAAVDFYRDRLGFRVLHHDGGFAALDLHGNLLGFFTWVQEGAG